MGSDLAHHNGEFRASIHRVLPRLIYPNPIDPSSSTPLPTYVFLHILCNDSTIKPYYNIATMGTETGVQHNLKEAEKAIEKLIGLMRVMMGHDDSDKDVVEFFPKYANSWKALNW